jgi:hypothetical protein
LIERGAVEPLGIEQVAGLEGPAFAVPEVEDSSPSGELGETSFGFPNPDRLHVCLLTPEVPGE